jgi:hypothetical protein
MRPSLKSFAIKYGGMPYRGRGGRAAKIGNNARWHKGKAAGRNGESDFPAPFSVQIELNSFIINEYASKFASILCVFC